MSKPKFTLDKPFVIVESAPRKRGKTYFNMKLLPPLEPEFREIHIFTPSLRYKDDYWAEFRKKPKYILHEKVSPEELEKVVVKQQEYVASDTRERRKRILDVDQRKDPKRSKTVFQAAYLNGRRRRRSKKWTEIKGVELEYTTPNPRYEFLYPDIFTGQAISLKNQNKTDPPKLLDILIIMDDCIDEGMFDASSLGNVIAHRGRHFNTSMICSTQHLTKVSFPIRNNIDYILFWRPHSIQEQENFLEKFVSRNNIRQFRKILAQAFRKPHDFILMDPHAMTLQEQFAIGDAEAFLNGNMTPLLTDHQVVELLQ